MENSNAPQFRIRKLTPREVLRLMDVDDSYIDKLINAENEVTLKGGVKKTRKVLSKSALYKLGGNSIVTNVLYNIFRTMFIPGQPEHLKAQPIQTSLFE